MVILIIYLTLLRFDEGERTLFLWLLAGSGLMPSYVERFRLAD